MKVFDSTASLRQLEGSPLLCLVRRIVLPVVSPPSYRPEEDGYVVLVEPSDVSRELSDLGLPYRLHEVPGRTSPSSTVCSTPCTSPTTSSP